MSAKKHPAPPRRAHAVPKKSVPRAVDDAAAQLRRLLMALPALADGERHPIASVAKAAGSTPEAVARDLRTLLQRYDDDPGGFTEGVRLAFGSETVQMQSAFFGRPMGLTPAELAALELGLAALEKELPPHEGAIAHSARGRIAKLAPGMTKARAKHGARAAAPTVSDRDGEHLSALHQAIGRRVKAVITYRSGSGAEGQPRTVHPYGMVHSHHWYLVAFCDKVSDLRIFRLDRILSVTLTSDPAAVPEAVALEEKLHHGRALVNHAEEHLVVRYSAKIARWIAEHEEGEAQKDGSYVVRHPLLDDDWAVRHVLQYGPDAVVMEPARIRDVMRARLRAMVQ